MQRVGKWRPSYTLNTKIFTLNMIRDREKKYARYTNTIRKSKII